jgi:hypothetical protein
VGESVTQEADRLVSDDRQSDYGHPLDNFGGVNEAAKALGLDPTASPENHALYMILVKISRQVNRPKRDNLVDIAGYAKTADLVIAERERRAYVPSEHRYPEGDEAPLNNLVAEEKLEVLQSLYRRNPERFEAEIGIYLTPERRRAVTGG